MRAAPVKAQPLVGHAAIKSMAVHDFIDRRPAPAVPWKSTFTPRTEVSGTLGGKNHPNSAQDVFVIETTIDDPKLGLNPAMLEIPMDVARDPSIFNG